MAHAWTECRRGERHALARGCRQRRTRPWLVVSAFLWLHTDTQFTNAWIVGLAAVAAAAAAALRYCFANTVLGGWLVLSVWILPTQNEATAINHFMVGAAMFIASLIPAARSPVPAL